MRSFKIFVALTLSLLLGLSAPFCLAEDTTETTASALEAKVGITAAEAEAKYQMIKKGSNSRVVKAVQAKLIELGYLDDNADGIYGQNTATAVELFETEQGLTVDGALEPLEIYYILDCTPMTRDEVVVNSASADDIASVQAALAVLPIHVNSAEVLVQSKLNKEAYPDMLTAVIENNTDKDITDYTVGFLAYDANGESIKILTQYDENAYLEILGDAEDINLPAGQTFGSSYGWRLQDNHGIGYLIACVQSATFADGTQWENPIYDIWKEAFAEKPLDASLRTE